MSKLARHLCFAAAWLSLLLGIIGILVPLLPTTPFVLLAAFLFSRSSPKFNHWITHHKFFGPMILDWRNNRRVSRSAKVSALVLVLISVTFIVVLKSGILH